MQKIKISRRELSNFDIVVNMYISKYLQKCNMI